MTGGGNLVSAGVLRVTGMEPDQGVAMNAAQRNLVERSLRVVGWLALALWVLILVVGLANNLYVRDIFDTEEAAYIVWPPFFIGVLSLWMRAYMRAGNHSA